MNAKESVKNAEIQAMIRSRMLYSLSKLNDRDTVKQGITEIMTICNETDVRYVSTILVCILSLVIPFILT